MTVAGAAAMPDIDHGRVRAASQTGGPRKLLNLKRHRREIDGETQPLSQQIAASVSNAAASERRNSNHWWVRYSASTFLSAA